MDFIKKPLLDEEGLQLDGIFKDLRIRPRQSTSPIEACKHILLELVKSTVVAPVQPPLN